MNWGVAYRDDYTWWGGSSYWKYFTTQPHSCMDRFCVWFLFIFCQFSPLWILEGEKNRRIGGIGWAWCTCSSVAAHARPRQMYHTIPYHTIPHHTIPYHTIPHHTIPSGFSEKRPRRPRRGRKVSILTESFPQLYEFILTFSTNTKPKSKLN